MQNDAREHYRQSQGPEIPAEKRLREEQHVEMQRSVVIRGIISVEAILRHLIDEPAVDSFVEMRRLYPEEQEAEKRAQTR